MNLEREFQWIDQREKRLIQNAINHQNISKQIIVRAATLIQSTARSKLARIKVFELKHAHGSAVIIQKHLRGKYGRKLALQARWRKASVAPTFFALKSMRVRSKETGCHGDWVEMFDPCTKSFWFLNKKEKSAEGVLTTCWDAPCNEFQEELVCRLPKDVDDNLRDSQACQRRFQNRKEYNVHRLHYHCWECPCCYVKNTGLTYPKCNVCGNTRGIDGEDKYRHIKTAANELQEK